MEDEDYQRFVFYLKQIAENNPANINQANESLQELKSQNIILYLTLAARVANTDGIDPHLIFLALSTIKDTCTHKKTVPIILIRQKWKRKDMPTIQMRTFVKQAIVKNLSKKEIPIRRIACAALAHVLQIEQDQWIEVLDFVLKTSSETDPFNIGAITVFNEIFYLNVIPNDIHTDKVDDSIFNGLLELIFQQLLNPSIEQEIKIQITKCLSELLANTKERIFSPNIVSHLLHNIIYSLLPTASSNLYREIHFLMLQLIKSLYANAPFFINDIFTITRLGIECPNQELQIISLHFWCLVWKFEKTILELKFRDDYNKNKPDEIYKEQKNHQYLVYHDITKNFSLHIINYSLVLLSQINPAAKITINDKDFDNVLYIQATIREMIDNLMIENRHNFQEIHDLQAVVNEMLTKNDIIQQHAAVQVLTAMMENHKYFELVDYVQTKTVEILKLTESDCEYLAVPSLNLLSLIIKNYEVILSNQPITNSIFVTMSRILTTFPDNQEIVIKVMHVFISIFNRLSPDGISANFDFFLDLTFSMHQKYISVEEEELSGTVQTAICTFISNCSPDSQIKLKQFLNSVIELFRNNLMNNNIENSNEKLLISLLCIIQSLILKLKKFAIEEIRIIIEILFNIINHKIYFLCEESMNAFKIIITSISTEFSCYAQPFMSIVNLAFSSQAPSLMTATCGAFALFCYQLGRQFCNYLKDEVINLFNWMKSIIENDQYMMIEPLVSSFSLIITGLENIIPLELLQEFWNYGFSITIISIDMKSKDDIRFAETLFTSLCNYFRAILRNVPQDVVNNFDFKQSVKKFLFPFINRIQLLSSSYFPLLKATILLLKTIGDKLGKSMNIMYHKKFVQDLFSDISFKGTLSRDYLDLSVEAVTVKRFLDQL
ncbi:hypothetical protein TRFO_16752 [Tritrichomonas foetus]|uniref:Importin N-terminal domain-containing protein n=1 Tax=Tritrichomonas foetus TaxID=1144522 RepID=A0A1J4KTV2_9EUKA|nr:hypothetical protein TRFO_16752 [Tritrichomonas foetus]|eukprot:OHT13196.1 hypothetical protein TRFO_16752 [Tritrichomonas foetus]